MVTFSLDGAAFEQPIKGLREQRFCGALSADPAMSLEYQCVLNATDKTDQVLLDERLTHTDTQGPEKIFEVLQLARSMTQKGRLICWED